MAAVLIHFDGRPSLDQRRCSICTRRLVRGRLWLCQCSISFRRPLVQCTYAHADVCEWWWQVCLCRILWPFIVWVLSVQSGAISICLSERQSPCRPVDISPCNVVVFFFLSLSVITWQGLFARQPVVHLPLQSIIVSHHVSMLFSIYLVNTLYFSLCNSYNQPFTYSLPVRIIGKFPFFFSCSGSPFPSTSIFSVHVSRPQLKCCDKLFFVILFTDRNKEIISLVQ